MLANSFPVPLQSLHICSSRKFCKSSARTPSLSLFEPIPGWLCFLGVDAGMAVDEVVGVYDYAVDNDTRYASCHVSVCAQACALVFAPWCVLSGPSRRSLVYKLWFWIICFYRFIKTDMCPSIPLTVFSIFFFAAHEDGGINDTDGQQGATDGAQTAQRRRADTGGWTTIL